MNYIDISVLISEKTPHWPSEPEIEFISIKKISEGGSSNVNAIKMSLHTGTHVDAPLHFIENGKIISEYDLSIFNGKAKVIQIKNEKEISLEEIINFKIEAGDIVLFKTQNSNSEWYKEKFKNDFVYLTPEAAEFLSNQKIKCVGIDYLSIAEKGKGKAVHQILLGNNIAIIEGLYLGKTKQGEYELLCLPLKILGEGAPARAILIEKKSGEKFGT